MLLGVRQVDPLHYNAEAAMLAGAVAGDLEGECGVVDDHLERYRTSG